jgi:hypothetical protein
MTREPALRCHASIRFRHLDGRSVFSRPMEGRWVNSPQPAAVEAFGTMAGLDGDQPIKLHIVDDARLTLVSRIDVHAGETQELDIAARFDEDQECYGFNNESYFRRWRNSEWRLDTGEYLVEVTVVSSGQICTGLFRLINRVRSEDFRLEDARPEDLARVR